MRKALLCMGVCLGLASMTAVGADKGWYAGASVGESKASDWCNIDFGDCEDTDTAWKLFGGHQINKNFAAELGYADLGEVTDVGVGIETKTIAVSALGMIPVGQASNIFGRLGFNRWDLSSSQLGDDSGTDPVYGIGASFGMGPAAALRLEWERFDVDDSDIDLLSVGVTYAFK